MYDTIEFLAHALADREALGKRHAAADGKRAGLSSATAAQAPSLETLTVIPRPLPAVLHVAELSTHHGGRQ